MYKITLKPLFKVTGKSVRNLGGYTCEFIDGVMHTRNKNVVEYLKDKYFVESIQEIQHKQAGGPMFPTNVKVATPGFVQGPPPKIEEVEPVVEAEEAPVVEDEVVEETPVEDEVVEEPVVEEAPAEEAPVEEEAPAEEEEEELTAEKITALYEEHGTWGKTAAALGISTSVLLTIRKSVGLA